MKKFMDKNFLLSTGTAQELYHEYAAKMPIVDYHCHINPQEIYEDRKFENAVYGICSCRASSKETTGGSWNYG